MLEGQFSEATNSAEEPIVLKEVSAAAFEKILE